MKQEFMADSALGQRHNGSHITEQRFSRLLAQRILDRPNGDPDDDLAVLARQLLRSDEVAAGLKIELRKVEGDYLTYVADTARLQPALWSLSRAAANMLVGVGVYNDRATLRDNDRIDGPVVDELSAAAHTARMALAGGVKLPETPDAPSVDSQSPSPARPNGLAPNPSGHPL